MELLPDPNEFQLRQMSMNLAIWAKVGPMSAADLVAEAQIIRDYLAPRLKAPEADHVGADVT